MFVVIDIDRSIEFYKKVLELHIILDFGANKTLTGGLALQTVETYKEFIGKSNISFGGDNFEIYFEEDERAKFEDIKGALSDAVCRRYDEAKTYRDGKWVMFEPTDTDEFDDYMKLLAIKRKPNRK